MSRVQSPRARADRASAGGGRIDQGSRSKIRDRLSRLASALEEPCFGGSPRGAHGGAPGRTKDQLEEIVAAGLPTVCCSGTVLMIRKTRSASFLDAPPPRQATER